MTIADCKRGRRKHKLDPRYHGLRRDAMVSKRRLEKQVEKEKMMRIRKSAKR